ncbi:hypothetical protein HOD83_00345 [Candidatus Woesearchaeota archaeon]|jgi:hypothetical protein|nr:hypothetical protein [Candidatus Woesearchaeota archaeon]MBT4114632.1 hypothetical protein [Candidatus Woesearchaeota archaeon]MBT4248026.1 hypothetical protein [Candidatus Woesearchaeota archaeon]
MEPRVERTVFILTMLLMLGAFFAGQYANGAVITGAASSWDYSNVGLDPWKITTVTMDSIGIEMMQLIAAFGILYSILFVIINSANRGERFGSKDWERTANIIAVLGSIVTVWQIKDTIILFIYFLIALFLALIIGNIFLSRKEAGYPSKLLAGGIFSLVMGLMMLWMEQGAMLGSSVASDFAIVGILKGALIGLGIFGIILGGGLSLGGGGGKGFSNYLGRAAGLEQQELWDSRKERGLARNLYRRLRGESVMTTEEEKMLEVIRNKINALEERVKSGQISEPVQKEQDLELKTDIEKLREVMLRNRKLKEQDIINLEKQITVTKQEISKMRVELEDARGEKRAVLVRDIQELQKAQNEQKQILLAHRSEIQRLERGTQEVAHTEQVITTNAPNKYEVSKSSLNETLALLAAIKGMTGREAAMNINVNQLQTAVSTDVQQDLTNTEINEKKAEVLQKERKTQGKTEKVIDKIEKKIINEDERVVLEMKQIGALFQKAKLDLEKKESRYPNSRAGIFIGRLEKVFIDFRRIYKIVYGVEVTDIAMLKADFNNNQHHPEETIRIAQHAQEVRGFCVRALNELGALRKGFKFDVRKTKGYMQDVAAIVVRLRTVMTQETQVIALAKELSLEFRGDIKLKKEEVVEAKQINHAGIKEVNDLAARYTGGYPGGDVTDAYGDLK